MLLFGSIFYSSALGWLRLSVFHAALPSAGVFLGAALVSSLAAAGAVGWYDKIVLERDALDLSSALLDFSNECRARMFPSLTPAQKLEEEHRQRTRYLDKFAVAIARVHKQFVANGLCHEGLEQTWLGYATTLDTADLAALASQSIADFGRQLPIPKQSWK